MAWWPTHSGSADVTTAGSSSSNPRAAGKLSACALGALRRPASDIARRRVGWTCAVGWTSVVSQRGQPRIVAGSVARDFFTHENRGRCPAAGPTPRSSDGGPDAERKPSRPSRGRGGSDGTASRATRSPIAAAVAGDRYGRRFVAALDAATGDSFCAPCADSLSSRLSAAAKSDSKRRRIHGGAAPASTG